MKIPIAMLAAAFGFAAPATLLAQASPPSSPQGSSSSSSSSSSALPTSGQVAGPGDQAAGASASDQQQTIMLSPFEVSTSKDMGYAATETLAGTRIATNLGDVAASISVIDQDFLNDVGALDQGTLLQYTTNAEVAGTESTYAGVGNGASVSEQSNLLMPQTADRIRGLAAADNARGYYITDIPWDSFDVDRIDILRGPNSILYGLGSPAGIVNATLKEAVYKDSGQVQERTGSYGSTRGTIDINKDLIDQVLAIRIDGMYDDRKYEQTAAYQNQKRIYGALRWDPDIFKNSPFHLTIKANAEAGDISSDNPRIIPPQDSITPWWRPNSISASNPFGGMGMTLVTNPYDPWRTDAIVPGDSRGLTQPGTANYQPWLQDNVNQQQPYWLFNGSNGSVYAVNGGYINVGAVDTNGNLLSASSGIAGKGTNGMFYGLAGLSAAAINYDLPGNQFGQYRNESLENSSVFDFYNTLIDGPTKQEWQKWTAYDVDITETGFNNRIGLDLTVDRQHFEDGGQALLGYSPTLTLDVLENFPDYYLSGANGETSVTNPNVGRPYTYSTGGSGSQYLSTRQVWRASAFGDVKASDFTSNWFLDKLFGDQRFNIFANNEQYYTQNLQWQMYANSQAWDGYWNGNNGLTNGFENRPPESMIYLGPSVIGHSSANNLNIPGIQSPITLAAHSVYVFDSTWTATGVSPGAVWNVPSSLWGVYEGYPDPIATTQLYQNSNPANYKGWNSSFVDNVIAYNNGQNPQLLTEAEQAFRETISYGGSWQGYLWNNAIVGTLGWRYDEVETKSVTALQQPSDRNFLDLDPSVYSLPNSFPLDEIFKDHSDSGGLVVHLNDFLPHDPLPVNVSFTYDNSSNFQVTNARVDVYGNPIPNPTGQDREWGFMLSTKDDRFSLRVARYDTLVVNDSSTMTNPGGIGTVIQQGLRYRNVFLYNLGVYTLDTENEPSYRNTWTNAYPNLSAAQAQQQEDEAITTWNNIQIYLQSKGFFQAWGFTPTTQSDLVDETTYLTNPAAYQPNPNTVYEYVATAPQGYTVTANTESKGWEFDGTVNPTPNWRIAFNAAETTAVESNVGGSALTGLVNYLNSQLYNPDGTPTPAGLMPQFGNPAYAIDGNLYGPWLADYTLLKLQEGSDVSELRKWRFNVITNYTFDHGWLKNFGVGGGYRWQAGDVIGYPVNTATGSYELNSPYYGPSEGEVDLWASYARDLTRKIGWKIQLNIYNAFARNGLIPISIEPDGQTWAAVRVKPIQEWDLTNTLTF